MITADKIKILTTATKNDLAMALANSGYTSVSFKTSKFLGMTNGGQFCYHVTYHDDAGIGEDEEGKVFLTYDSSNDRVIADY